jgi:hypothetical protein
MNKIILAGLAAVAAIALMPISAQAQSIPVQKPITIKLGIFLPTNGSVKDHVGKTFFAAGAELGLSKQAAAQTTEPLLYVDYNGKSSSGQHIYDTGVGIGVKQYLGDVDASSTPYVGAGVGAYFDQAKVNGSSENKTNLGFKLDVGYEFDHAALIEADYTDAGSAAGVNADGFSILLGYRF